MTAAPSAPTTNGHANGLSSSFVAAGTRGPPRILDSILDHIGDTPLVRCDRLAAKHGLQCNLLAKCEFFNAGGSVKDRIAKRMVLEAEKEGRLIPGKSVVIEPTSGNTGIGLALACALHNYRCIIVMPTKMSAEKATTLTALGAEIVRTPTEAAYDDPESHIMVARRLEKEIPGGVILDQYKNVYNPVAHYDTTAPEIIELLPPGEDPLHLLVAGAGTGGTISGLSKRLREAYGTWRPSTASGQGEGVYILGVDPHGSLLARPESLNEGKVGGYLVEGTGYEFIPDVLNHAMIDSWLKTTDSESFAMTRDLIRVEGLLCGGSSGGSMSAAVRFLKSEEGNRFDRRGANVVVVLADGLRNYITKPWLLKGGEETESEEATGTEKGV